MKLLHKLITFLICMNLVSCLGGNRRSPKSAEGSSPIKGSSGEAFEDIGVVSSDGNTQSPEDTETSNSATSDTTGYENCNVQNVAPYTTSNTIGPLRICQNKNNKNKFKVIIDQAHVFEEICFFPLYKDSSNNSTYLGSAQCTYNQAGQELEGEFNRNRGENTKSINPQVYNYYMGLPLNGTMVLTRNRVQSFLDCMNADSTSANQYTTSPYYFASMTYLCSLFKSYGNYIDVTFSSY